MTTNAPPLLLTVEEAAEQMRLHRATLYIRIANGELEAVDLASPGSKKPCLRVPYEAVRAYVDSLPRVIESPAATAKVRRAAVKAMASSRP